MSKNKETRLCGNCCETGTVIYTSNPPQVKCRLDGEFHALDDGCSLKEDEKIELKEPRLCEILGVKVYQLFYIGDSQVKFLIDENGIPKVVVPNGGFFEVEGNDIYKAINDPSLIHKTPLLTEKEFTICKIFGVKRVTREMDSSWVDLWNENSSFARSDGLLAEVWCNFFPSVKPGDCIEVKDFSEVR